MKLIQTARECQELAEKIDKADRLGFDTEFHGPQLESGKFLNVFRATLTGYSVLIPCDDDYYVPVAHNRGNAPAAFAYRPLDALRSTKARVRIHNAKNEHHILGWLPKNFDCTMVMAWLLEMPGLKGSYGLKQLAEKHLDLTMKDFESVAKGRGWNELDPHEAIEYATDDAIATAQLGDKLEPLLRKWSLVKAYEEQELPLIPVLAAMERRGMAIDRDHLLALADRLEKHVTELREEWDFNFPGVLISSPKQIREHFLDGGLWPKSGVERTKTGLLSVNRHTMELALAHPRTPAEGKVAAEIRMEFQDANKILNTYTHTLVAKADQHLDGRIHCNFLQTGTRTGRLSCVDPNLMNIPVRSKLGMEVKKAFVAAPGHKLVSADYSQLELRILAHLAGPGKLREAFAPDAGDFFDRMAEDMDQPRDHVKTGMYAYVYGASPRKIGKTLGIGDKGGSSLIRRMEQTYPELPKLRDKLVVEARDTGVIRTLAGRLRRLPNILADNKWERFSDERRAGNTPIQGSGADIVKMAMIKAHNAGLHLTCQVHDEIVCEENEHHLVDRLETKNDHHDWGADRKMFKAHQKVLKESMVTAWPGLEVALKADPVVVDSWDETKEK